MNNRNDSFLHSKTIFGLSLRSALIDSMMKNTVAVHFKSATSWYGNFDQSYFKLQALSSDPQWKERYIRFQGQRQAKKMNT